MDNGSSSDITGLSADALAELERQLAAEGVDAGTAETISRRDPAAPTPASFSQELLWMLDRATPGLTAYNLPMAHRVHGPLDVRALEVAITTVVGRHEALRTHFADGDGHPVQVVHPAGPVPIDVRDLSAVPSAERVAAAERAVNEQARTPFDLSHAPPFRVTLLRLADDDHVLLIESHHIVWDGWSTGVVFNEISAAYAAARAGHAPALAPVPIQFGDIAAWERTRLSGSRLDELLTFWREQLGSASEEPLALPTDFGRPATPTFAGARESVLIPTAQVARIKQLAQSHQATLYMALLAAYATVLHRYTQRTNVLIGSGSAGRSLPETNGVVGYLNNTLVQRADFSGDPGFSGLLARVRTSAVGAYDHQDIPLEKLVLELRQGQERLSDAPLFEVVLTMQDLGGGSFTLAGLDVETFGVKLGATKFDITLFGVDRPDGLGLIAQYRSDLFAPATMRRFLGHLTQVLESAVADPNVPVSRIPMLTHEERAQLASWNDTAEHEGAPSTFVELFERQAARVAARRAVVDSAGGSLTYEALNAAANRVAHRLRALGVSRGAPVAMLVDRTPDAIVALLGILKAGGAYVPLATDAPAARIHQQIAECGATCAVTMESFATLLPAGIATIALDRAADRATLDALPATNPAAVATPDSLAYVLFTSGSTGTPKGVAVTHANAVHYTRAVSRVLGGVRAGTNGDGLAALDGLHFALASTLAADLGNTSLFPSLAAGGTLHMLGTAVTTDPAQFAAYAAQHPIDVLKITPNHLAALVAGKAGAELAAVLPHRWTVVGGEALRPDVARALLAAGTCRLLNHYGPTETTVGVCTFEVTPATLDRAASFGARTVPVGYPLPNTRAYVVDAHAQDVPVGIPGELWLGGDGVTAGYLKRPELTAERFVAFRNETVYRTGDRVRRLEDGSIEFLGRTDDQVKVRGYRVELGEVEQVLRGHPGVQQCVVLLRADSRGEPVLVAYVVARQEGYAVSHSDRPTREKLTEWVAAQLPSYMVPGDVVLLEKLPLTANGKVDRAQLPVPGVAASSNAYVAPRTPTEERLVAIWQDALKKEQVGTTDNFLDLGGHSLTAIRILGKISRTFSVRLPLRTLFDNPTIGQLAEAVDMEVKLAAIEKMSDEEAAALLASMPPSDRPGASQ